jgi:hypothetical protein
MVEFSTFVILIGAVFDHIVVMTKLHDLETLQWYYQFLLEKFARLQEERQTDKLSKFFDEYNFMMSKKLEIDEKLKLHK